MFQYCQKLTFPQQFLTSWSISWDSRDIYVSTDLHPQTFSLCLLRVRHGNIGLDYVQAGTEHFEQYFNVCTYISERLYRFRVSMRGNLASAFSLTQLKRLPASPHKGTSLVPYNWVLSRIKDGVREMSRVCFDIVLENGWKVIRGNSMLLKNIKFNQYFFSILLWNNYKVLFKHWNNYFEKKSE